MNRRRLALSAVLVVAGAGLAAWATTRTWWVVVTERQEPLPALRETVTGRDEAGWAFALALVALAGLGAFAASRGVGRRILAVLVAVTGAGIVAAGVLGLQPPHEAAEVSIVWPSLVTLSGFLVVAGGLIVAARPGRSPESSAVARPSEGTPVTPANLWDALDAGEDPTTVGADGRNESAR